MASIKTAISLQAYLLEQVDTLARKLDVSRSRLFVLAAQEFIQRHRNRELLEAINAAYDGFPDPEEQTVLRRMRNQHKRLVEEQW